MLVRRRTLYFPVASDNVRVTVDLRRDIVIVVMQTEGPEELSLGYECRRVSFCSKHMAATQNPHGKLWANVARMRHPMSSAVRRFLHDLARWSTSMYS